jgi:hypothetical protein
MGGAFETRAISPQDTATLINLYPGLDAVAAISLAGGVHDSSMTSIVDNAIALLLKL